MCLSVLRALRSLKSPALLGTMRGSTTTLTFTALLCLGELQGRVGVGTPLLPHLVTERPQDVGGSVGTHFLGGEGTVLSPDLTPALRAQSRPGVSRRCGGAGRSQGTLFQGCAGARGTRDNQVSPQTSCFHPPPLVPGEHSGSGLRVAYQGGAWVTAGEPGGEGALTLRV